MAEIGIPALHFHHTALGLHLPACRIRYPFHTATVQSSSSPPFRHPLRAGGGSDKVYRLHPLEKVVIFFAAALLIFQPWAVGGMYLWTQYVAGALALCCFVTALIPRSYTDVHHAGPNLRLVMWPKLLRFPFFWLGLVYFAYVLIQIYNPAWIFVSSSKGWWLRALNYIEWLPHGVSNTPATMMNGWRTLLIQGAAWMLVCALWVGLTRRKSVRILITAITLNGTTLALVVLLQRLTGTKEMLWLWKAPADYFAGSFIYKNHAGEFFLLIIGCCLGLAWWHKVKAERELRKSNPSMIFVALALLVFLALTFTYARATTVLGALLLLLAAIGYGLQLFFRRSDGPPAVVSALTALMGIGFVALCIASLNTESVFKRFERLTEQDEFSSITTRQLATQATFEMAKDDFWFGQGAGSFRFVFPKYQQNYPDIWRLRYFHKKSGEYRYGKRLFWEYAHNDYAQLLAENGVIGATLFGSLVLFILGGVRKHFAYRQPALLLLLASPGLVALSAWVDFPTHNPAILVGGCAIVALSLRWAALSHR